MYYPQLISITQLENRSYFHQSRIAAHSYSLIQSSSQYFTDNRRGPTNKPCSSPLISATPPALQYTYCTDATESSTLSTTWFCKISLSLQKSNADFDIIRHYNPFPKRKHTRTNSPCSTNKRCCWNIFDRARRILRQYSQADVGNTPLAIDCYWPYRDSRYYKWPTTATN